MAAEAPDLAADLLAALGSSVAQELSQPAPAVSDTAASSADFLTCAAPDDDPDYRSDDGASACVCPRSLAEAPAQPGPGEEIDAKRQRMNQDISNIDMAMLLQGALGSLDEQLNPADETDQGGLEEPQAIPSATATPAPVKAGAEADEGIREPAYS